MTRPDLDLGAGGALVQVSEGQQCPPAQDAARLDEEVAPAVPSKAVVEVLPSSIAKGAQGLFAVERILPDQLIIEELPIATVQNDGTASMRAIYDQLTAKGQHEALLRGAHLWLGPPDGPHDSGYREWAERCVAEEEDQKSAAEAMLALTFNAYASTPGGCYQLVYPVISKANHSCSPNAVVMAPEKGPGSIQCVREIAPGEEVLVSYIADVDLVKTSVARRRILEDHWEFQCACPRCDDEVDDSRRFACPSGCSSGSCQPLLGAGVVEGGRSGVTPCNVCGKLPEEAVVAEWIEEEEKVEALVEGLPGSLYSAWAPCEDFATAHPQHWLAHVWKLSLAAKTDLDADDADTASEAEELRAEAVAHREAAERCRLALLRWT